MDVIIVCHTEYGFVYKYRVLYHKDAHEGVEKGIRNLSKIADKYTAKITYSLMPEVLENVPKKMDSEIGLHLHPGWKEWRNGDFSSYIGDKYLRTMSGISKDSTVMRDYSYKEQLELIRIGRDRISCLLYTSDAADE